MSTDDTTTIITTLATEINALHTKAVRHADCAIDFAKQAGELLLKVKSDMSHGAFLPWLEANCTVTPRQAQRYMAAAQGKPMPVRVIKCDTVSYLPDATKTDTVSDLPDDQVANRAEPAALRRLHERMELNYQGQCENSLMLRHIQESGLYLLKNPTFESYCRERFGLEPEDVEELHAQALLHKLRADRLRGAA